MSANSFLDTAAKNTLKTIGWVLLVFGVVDSTAFCAVPSLCWVRCQLRARGNQSCRISRCGHCSSGCYRSWQNVAKLRGKKLALRICRAE